LAPPAAQASALLAGWISLQALRDAATEISPTMTAAKLRSFLMVSLTLLLLQVSNDRAVRNKYDFAKILQRKIQ
jgi:hypothetical protein